MVIRAVFCLLLGGCACSTPPDVSADGGTPPRDARVVPSEDAGRDATVPRDARAPTDAGERDSGVSPPPVEPPGPETRYEDCDPPPAPAPVEVTSDGCESVTEGRIQAVRATADGVAIVLRQGFDERPGSTCEVQVTGVGADIAADIAWSVGAVYAAYISPGSPGELWLADGDDWWSCGTLSPYPLVLHVGGRPFGSGVPTYTGAGVEPAWGATGCRYTSDCETYALAYEGWIMGRDCAQRRSGPVDQSETNAFEVDGVTRRLRTLHSYTSVECPLPDDEGTTSDLRGGAWAMWSTAAP